MDNAVNLFLSDRIFATLHSRFLSDYDVFSSTTVGALLNGFSLDKALAVAADYTVACIKETISHPDHNWYGVDFETEIPYLLKLIGK